MSTAVIYKIHGRKVVPEIRFASPMSSTVLDLKQAIESRVGVAVGRQRLFPKGGGGGGELLNDRTLGSYKLRRDAAEDGKEEAPAVVDLDLTVEPLRKKKKKSGDQEKIPFVVKCGGKEATVILRESDTAEKLFWEVAAKLELCSWNLKLRCCGKDLARDGTRLYEYYLSEGTVVEVAAGEGFHRNRDLPPGCRTFPPSFYSS